MNVKHLALGAVLLGASAGYLWSAVSPAAPVASGKSWVDKGRKSPALIDVPQTVDQDAADRAWASGDAPAVTPTPAELAARDDSDVYYPGCNAVRAAGKAPLYAGQPGYSVEMDGDGDGVACEPHRNR